MLGFAQLMMHKTAIVGASDQIHARLKSEDPMGGMTRSAGHARQSLPERGIQAFNESGVEDATPSRSLQQLLGLREQTMSHPPRDLDDPFVLRALDHRANVQLRPDLQARSSHSRSSLDLLAERSADAARVRAPAVRQHEQGTQASRASANLGQQAISQAAIPRGWTTPASQRRVDTIMAVGWPTDEVTLQFLFRLAPSKLGGRLLSHPAFQHHQVFCP